MGTQKFQNVSVVEFTEENCTLFQQVLRFLSFFFNTYLDIYGLNLIFITGTGIVLTVSRKITEYMRCKNKELMVNLLN